VLCSVDYDFSEFNFRLSNITPSNFNT